MMYLLVLALAIFSVVSSEEQYNTKHDDFDVESLVNDKEQLQAFASCFTDKGVCSDIQAHFKKDLAEAIKEDCAKCTPAQKYILKLYLLALKQKISAEYEEFKNKYDPEGKHLAVLEA